MATLIEMPKLSDTMTTGKILSWLNKEGDAVKAGQAIAEVETDKATMELECFEDGILLKILAPAESAIPIGGPIAILGKAGENVEEMARQAAEKVPQSPDKPTTKSNTTIDSPVAAASMAPAASNIPVQEEIRLRVSPVAQRMAAEYNIDIRQVPGSGPSGRVIKRDIENFLAKAPAPAPQPAISTPTTEFEDVPLNSIRTVIAQRMPQSLGPIPHFYLEIDFDVQPLVSMKDQLRSIVQDAHITITDILIKACALALQRHPEINSSFLGATVRRFKFVNIGLAVAAQGNLLVPVIPACQTKSIGQIARERSLLVEKAQKGKLTPTELSGGTFTISNLGMMGITRFCAIINPHQAAVLAVGSIREEPVVKNGAIIPGKRLALTLSCDHRAFDGAEGAIFMATLKQILENPLVLCL